MKDELIEIENKTLKYPGIEIKIKTDAIRITSGLTVVTGPNGCGKSIFGRILERGWNLGTNRIKSPKGKLNVKIVEFNDIHSLSGCKTEYYQQRFEATMNDEIPTVENVFASHCMSERWISLCEILNIADVNDKRLNYLSSGELRKLLVINAICNEPDLLILDNPYIGLDTPSRESLNEAIKTLTSAGMSVMLLTASPDEIPDYTSCIIPMHDMEILNPIYPTTENISNIKEHLSAMMDFEINYSTIPTDSKAHKPYCTALEMKSCNVRYGKRHIICNEWWTVKSGERWGLSGPNGCGKSVLLSLIYADNPQAYSNDITIFDRRRGSGESIWDIKDRIGYVSPEMHLYFNSAGPSLDIVARGRRSAAGNFGNIADNARQEAMQWMTLLGIGHLADRRYATLSSGEQRMILIARTLIKHPDLLILDEPLHGLDSGRKKAVIKLIDIIVKRNNMTLIYVTHYDNEMPGCIEKIKTLKRQ